jgi:PhzF family phenazine biosynthesis protein
MEYFIVDAFAEEEFGGNPAGVVIYEELDEKFMQSFAAEVRFSETAFIKRIDKENFDIRFFTPVSEVDLCGHATIASFKALLECGEIEDNHRYYMRTKTGVLPIYLENSFVMMEQGKPGLGRVFEDYGEIAGIFNISPEDIGDKNYGLVPQACSTGLWDMMLPLKTEKALYELSPDFGRLAEYSRANGLCGVHAFTLDTEESVALCRNFCPLYGIDEEAATGTSNGALAYYLYKYGIIKELNKDYTFLQGCSMNRPSTITTRLVDRDNTRVMVGGKAVVVARGNIL